VSKADIQKVIDQTDKLMMEGTILQSLKVCRLKAPYDSTKMKLYLSLQHELSEARGVVRRAITQLPETKVLEGRPPASGLEKSLQRVLQNLEI
jgi:hypothetical protein